MIKSELQVLKFNKKKILHIDEKVTNTVWKIKYTEYAYKFELLNTFANYTRCMYTVIENKFINIAGIMNLKDLIPIV